MDSLRQYIKPGEVYRRSDLEYFSAAIDRHLSQLTKERVLVKLNQGIYYAPKQSKFGTVPPDDHALIERFLKVADFLLVTPNAYNTLGLGLTQLYNTTWVYNHKRRGEIHLNGKSFVFKHRSSFPKTITREYLLVDLLNNLEELAEDQVATVHKLKRNIRNFNSNELMKMTQQYGSGKTKQIVKAAMRKTLLQHA